MKKNLLFLFWVFTVAYLSCSPSTDRTAMVSPANILKDDKHFLFYYNKYLKLSEDFIPLNAASQVIKKEVFLSLLMTGDFLPLRLNSKDTPCYKLYPINTTIDENTSALIKSSAYYEYANYQLEGKALPGFNFIDIKGKKYDTQTTKGKIIVLNFWFIHCQACVEEIPALNSLVKQYEDRKDILFISLAFDNKEELKKFLIKTVFNYAIVPNMKKYLLHDMRIPAYPTHLIINKKGIVIEVVNDHTDMEIALKKVVSN